MKEVLSVDATVDPSYSGSAEEMYIPQGMYFFTENAPKETSATYQDWMNATILVVSSTETVEATNAGRAVGDGFSLVEMKVSDLNFYQGSNAAQWQLVKEENERTIIERSFVYNKDGRVTVQARGDKAYVYQSQDWLLNTYLIVEAPEISYPATEGHISLVSELGYYISMNEDRDGIVINENQYSFYLQVTDKDAVVPSFYISNKGMIEDGNRS